MVLHFALDTKGLILLLFIPSKAGVTQQQQQLGSLSMAQHKKEPQPAASPNQPMGPVRDVLFCATKNAQMKTKAKVTKQKTGGQSKAHQYC